MVKRRRNVSSTRRVRRKMPMRRKFRGRRKVVSRSRIPRSLVPKRFKRTMTYVDKIALNAPLAGGPQSWFFSCNSLYDPDRTGTGHQPRGFDEIMPMFDHYVVIGAKMVITAAARTDTAGDAQQIVAIKIKDNPVASTNMVDLLENGDVVYKTLGGANSSKGILQMSKSINPNKFLGRSKPMADPQLKGSVAANPAEECYFEIVTGAIGTGDPATIDILVTISYTAVFIEPKDLARS